VKETSQSGAANKQQSYTTHIPTGDGGSMDLGISQGKAASADDKQEYVSHNTHIETSSGSIDLGVSGISQGKGAAADKQTYNTHIPTGDGGSMDLGISQGKAATADKRQSYTTHIPTGDGGSMDLGISQGKDSPEDGPKRRLRGVSYAR
jgi:hypothetical protein